MKIKIATYDDPVMNGDPLYDNVDKRAYLDDPSVYSNIVQKPSEEPSDSWAVPFITKHKYHVHWRYGLDFDRMKIDISPKWETTDSPVLLVFNHTDVRAKIEVLADGVELANLTLEENSRSSGYFTHYNDTDKQELHMLFNGKADTELITMIGHRCIGSCLEEIVEAQCEETFRYWSDPAAWDSGVVPILGETVEI